MKILADENVDAAIVTWLRDENNDVWYAAETPGQYTDEELLDLAHDQERVVITFDLDFGELVFRLGKPTLGVLLLRFASKTQEDHFNLFKFVWPNVQDALENHFVVATNRKIRIRPL